MQLWVYLIIGLAAAILILLMIIEAMIRKNRKRKKVQAETGVVENKDIRLSAETDEVDADGVAQATLAHHDIIVSKGQTMTAGKKADLKPGKYTILTAVEGNEAFNVRMNGFVREIKHGTSIVLGDGDTICPVSETVVLR